MLGENHVEKRPAEVKRIDAEGHELANHTWSHQILTDIGPGEAKREMSRLQDAVRKITGKTPKLMRLPQGRTDESVSKISKDLGLAQVLWSVTAKDYQTNDSALITKRVLEQTERDGIILLHDIYRGTVPAVPGILKELKQRGYTIVTVSQLLSPAKPGQAWSTARSAAGRAPRGARHRRCRPGAASPRPGPGCLDRPRRPLPVSRCHQCRRRGCTARPSHRPSSR